MGLRSYIMVLGLAGIGAVATAGVAVAHTGALNDWPYAAHAGQATTYTLATVGDIACEPGDAENTGTPAALKCGSPTLGGLSAEYATAQQADAMHPDLVALLGDEQYQVGKLSDFEQWRGTTTRGTASRSSPSAPAARPSIPSRPRTAPTATPTWSPPRTRPSA